VKNDWSKIITNAAVLVGLALVLYELNQNQGLARSQAQLDDFIAIQAFSNTLMGENPSIALVKARENPDQLSAEDRVVVNAYLESIFARMNSYEFVDVFDGDWESSIYYDLEKSFNFEYAREWWEREKGYSADWSPRIREIIEDFFVSNPSF